MKYGQTPWTKRLYTTDINDWESEVTACTIVDANNIEMFNLEFFFYDEDIDNLANFIIETANARGYNQ